MTQTTISARELHDLIAGGRSINLIDVRTPVEFREVHISAARNVPLHELKPTEFISAASDPSSPLYVVCKSGGRGKQACEKLRSAGCQHVINVDGGTAAWDQAGFSVIRGKKAISLERQVRIGAGSLLVIGTALAIFVNPWFVLFDGFIGCGLVFAGVTDFCGMGLVLAKMPWNKVGSTNSSGPGELSTTTQAAGHL